jgi:hypothetical protein
MLEAFADMAYANAGKRIVLYTVSLLSRERLDLPTKERSEGTEFSVEVSPFQSCVGVQVKPKVASLFRRGNGNVIEEDRRAGRKWN